MIDIILLINNAFDFMSMQYVESEYNVHIFKSGKYMFYYNILIDSLTIELENQCIAYLDYENIINGFNEYISENDYNTLITRFIDLIWSIDEQNRLNSIMETFVESEDFNNAIKVRDKINLIKNRLGI